MTRDEDRKPSRVEVVTSTRMANPADPDDVMHGRRFVGPTTGRPASIVEILERTGMIPAVPGKTGNGSGDTGA